ncbi:PhnA domain-containing protein [Sunxiuqinia sp. sy24]|uniref:PhnA domain-containing protein n=1 Tax=Sunxiuqinia sp. sy24 TaxID=3461495 RepID=UPI0040464123
MSLEKKLLERSGSACELCGSNQELKAYEVPPKTNASVDESILVCANCLTQIENPDQLDVNHWHCLNDSMWSQEPAVQVMAWRMLNHLRGEGWAQNLLDMFYLEEEVLEWAKTGQDTGAEQDETPKHVDSNGVPILAGDTVVLIKDLNVKGTSFVAKRGTAVRGISLVHDNPEHIEGRVNGQQIVILTKFTKKTN